MTEIKYIAVNCSGMLLVNNYMPIRDSLTYMCIQCASSGTQNRAVHSTPPSWVSLFSCVHLPPLFFLPSSYILLAVI